MQGKGCKERNVDLPRVILRHLLVKSLREALGSGAASIEQLECVGGVREEVKRPGGCLERRINLPRRVAGRDRESVARVALAVAKPRRVAGECDGVEAALAHALKHVA